MSSVVQIARNHCRTREAIKKVAKKLAALRTQHTRVKRRRCRIRSLPMVHAKCRAHEILFPNWFFGANSYVMLLHVSWTSTTGCCCNAIINRWWKLLLDNSSSDECAREMRKTLFSKSTQAKDQVEPGSPSCFLCLPDDDLWQVQLFIRASVPTALSLLQRSNGHKSRFERCCDVSSVDARENCKLHLAVALHWVCGNYCN